MMTNLVQISDAEWDVMEVVWATGACAAAHVIDQLSATHDWNHRTVRTLLARLVEKGALEYEVDGPRYIYRAVVSRRECVRQESRWFAEKIFGGNVAELLVHFVKDAPLGSDEIAELRKLLDEKDQRKGKKR